MEQLSWKEVGNSLENTGFPNTRCLTSMETCWIMAPILGIMGAAVLLFWDLGCYLWDKS
jgi:hypothetical protein